MTDHPITPPPELVQQGMNDICYGSSLPVAYRLVREPDGNGNDVPVLQGYYAWTSSSGHGGEWRSLETQDWPYTDDKIPHPSLP